MLTHIEQKLQLQIISLRILILLIFQINISVCMNLVSQNEKDILYVIIHLKIYADADIIFGP